MRITLFLLGLFFCLSCTKKTENITAHLIENPAPPGSKFPNLFIQKDKVYLSWITSVDSVNVALQFAVFQEGKWTQPKTIATGDNWFVNWADFPSMAVTQNGLIAAHWLEKSGEDTYAYDIRVVLSKDEGNSWSNSFVLHSDNLQAEHGFVTLISAKDKIFATWLDGRNTVNKNIEEEKKSMTIRAAFIDENGKISDEVVLDERTCDCCQTDAIMTSDGPIVLYRDRSEDEIRDIAYVKYSKNKWPAPLIINKDNWKIKGCPVNGPAIDNFENNLATSWYTASENIKKVKLSFSKNNGDTFQPPIIVAKNNAIGRVDVVFLPKNKTKLPSALVSWVDTKDQNAAIKIKNIRSDGLVLDSLLIAQTSKARASGFPVMARVNNDVLISWTDIKDESTKIKTSIISLPKEK